MKAIRNGYELWLASYLVRSLVMLLFRQEIWYLHADGRRRFGFRAAYDLYNLGFFGEAPSGDMAQYTTCRLAFFVLCSFVPGTSHALFFH